MSTAVVPGYEKRVLLVYDRPELSRTLARLLASVGFVDAVHVSDLATKQVRPSAAVVCDIDLKSKDGVHQVERGLSDKAYRTVPRVVVTETRRFQNVIQAGLLGATDTISRPFDPDSVLGRFRSLFAAKFDGDVAELGETLRHGLSGAHTAFRKVFEGLPSGQALTLEDVTSCEEPTIEALRTASLRGWLDGVKQHHAQSYRHCLSVTGIAVAFAQHLGMSAEDQRRIARAAVVHDIGKAFIPLAILDKPGKLTDDEMATMRNHARLGYDVLVRQDGFSAEALDAVRHHHEALDGSGYPDGLAGNAIPDVTRIITISDIFSALIEERAYKTPIPSAKAFAIMGEMTGKLDMDLLRAFQPVAANI